ncbi:unnamed protein product [Prunus armeniaca]
MEILPSYDLSSHDDGHVRLAGAKKLGEVSITVAEFFALRDGLAYAVSKGWRYIMVEGDSKLVIDSVKNLCSVPVGAKIKAQVPPPHLMVIIKDGVWFLNMEIKNYLLEDPKFSAPTVPWCITQLIQDYYT